MSPGNGIDHDAIRDIARLLQLLGTAWLLEPDAEMLEHMAVLPPLREAAMATTPDRAALEYSRIILQQVPPYASLFLDEKAMLNGPHAEEALRAYNRHGFSILPEWRAGPADHLGLELHFLAHLIQRDSPAWHAVLEDQILTWTPLCCLAIQRIESAQLYLQIAVVTLTSLIALSPNHDKV